MNSFPFTAVEIAELLDLDLPKKHHSNWVSINYVCPVCGKPKFNLNTQKQVFHCPVCADAPRECRPHRPGKPTLSAEPLQTGH